MYKFSIRHEYFKLHLLQMLFLLGVMMASSEAELQYPIKVTLLQPISLPVLLLVVLPEPQCTAVTAPVPLLAANMGLPPLLSNPENPRVLVACLRSMAGRMSHATCMGACSSMLGLVAVGCETALAGAESVPLGSRVVVSVSVGLPVACLRI